LTNIIGSLFLGLPAEHHAAQTANESFYHSLLWAYCSGLVPQARAEEPGAMGDLDIILVLKDGAHVVMELKYAKDEGQTDIAPLLEKLARKALAAIKEKRYGDQYRRKGTDFITVGLGVFGRGQVKALFG
jgi:hypothetical protein